MEGIAAPSNSHNVLVSSYLLSFLQGKHIPESFAASGSRYGRVQQIAQIKAILYQLSAFILLQLFYTFSSLLCLGPIRGVHASYNRKHQFRAIAMNYFPQRLLLSSIDELNMPLHVSRCIAHILCISPLR